MIELAGDQNHGFFSGSGSSYVIGKAVVTEDEDWNFSSRGSFVHIRLILQPSWLRFVVWALFLAVVWGALTSFQSRSEIESTILSAIFFGAAIAGLLTATTQSVHRGAAEALSGLSQAERSQAIDAVLHGTVPADPEVRASATRLGRVFLRNKSADQLKRSERLTLLTFGVVIALAVAAAVANFANERLFYLAVAVVCAIGPFSLVNTRRIRRNVALLAGGHD
jgi:hypothetical protein